MEPDSLVNEHDADALEEGGAGVGGAFGEAGGHAAAGYET